VRLQGRRAIITGAGSGIGRAAARAFAVEGARVLATDVARGVYDTADLVEGAGGSCIPVLADVGVEGQVEGVIATAVEQWGGLDVMFANAGTVGALAPVTELTAADWEATIRVNLMGTFFCLKHAVKRMLDDGVAGTVICTASVAGLRAGGGPAHYSATKAAVINLVQNAACQLAGTGIRVNAICPGLIETGMTKPIFDMARQAGKQDRIGQLNPLRRAGQPEEIAAMVVHLASDDASYVNGEALVIDGGLAAGLPMIPGKMW